MRTFASYFSRDEILRHFVKKRIAYTEYRHDKHFADKIAYLKPSKKTKKEKDATGVRKYLEDEKKLLHDIFPPRRSWKRCPVKKRRDDHKGNSTKILEDELFFTARKGLVKLKTEIIPECWAYKLSLEIEKVRQALVCDSYIIQAPVGLMYKYKVKGRPECRVLAKYSTTDGIVNSIVTRYFTDHTDLVLPTPYFSRNSYAFRSRRLVGEKTGKFTHHLAVKRIQDYRLCNSDTELYVSEVDLKKFFDTVNISVLKDLFKVMCDYYKSNGSEIDARAVKIALSCLDSYSFNHLVPLETKNRKFGWPVEELLALGIDIEKENIGIPQGSAMSGFFANLLLNELDALFDVEDTKLLYARFCDDFIIIHTDKEKCGRMFDDAIERLESLKLVPHKPGDSYILTDYKNQFDKKEYGLQPVNSFWNKSKSKKTYRWAKYSANGTERTNVPWLAFVGYQIRYDGVLRVRKSSLKKERTKQKRLVLKTIRRVEKAQVGRVKQSLNKIKYRVEQKLISMSVGKIRPQKGLYGGGYCWANGFQMLKGAKRVNSQLTYLDRNRNRLLKFLERRLNNLNDRFSLLPPKKGHGEVDKDKPKNQRVKVNRILTSYYGYFNRKTTPT